jgi:single-stranded DNA-binding protein
MNKCNFLGRFAEDPVIDSIHDTTVCRFKVNVEEYRKDKEGFTKKRNNILTFEAWDTQQRQLRNKG